MKHRAAKNVHETVEDLVNSKEAKDARDDAIGAVLVNDYIAKQLFNDPKNHIKEHEVTEMIVGKPKGQIINWLAGEASRKITDAIEQGSQELSVIKEMRDQASGQKRDKIIEKAENAQDAYNTTKARMEKTQRALSIIKDKMEKDELNDYKYLRGKIEKIVGDKDAADDVLKEAIIQNIN